MKRSTSLIELREAGFEDVGVSNMRRARSQQDLAGLSRQSGASTPSTPPSGHASRVPMLSEKELRDHFNMPLNEVAKKFGMCTTALKKLCRKYGVMQWPHRKLRSLEKKIASLRAEQRYTTDGHVSGNLDEEIRKLEAQREALITGNGDFADDDKAWSPGALSPADFTENADMNTGFQMQELTQPAYKPKTDLPRTLQKGPVNDWTTENLTKQLQDKQNHLQQLEDENSNLRALSRSLMKERQELVKNLNSSSTEMEQLRNLCQQLTSQLNMVMGQTNTGMVKQQHAPQYIQQAAASHRTGMGGSWSDRNEAPGMMQQSPMMEPSTWAAAQQQETPTMSSQVAMQGMQVMPGMQGMQSMQGIAGPVDDSMHSLSWMAPDFDIDELI